jgi:hypothetical protein
MHLTSWKLLQFSILPTDWCNLVYAVVDELPEMKSRMIPIRDDYTILLNLKKHLKKQKMQSQDTYLPSVHLANSSFIDHRTTVHNPKLFM